MHLRSGRSLLIISLLAALLTLSACAAPAPASAPASQGDAAPATEAQATEAQDIVTWYYYDQDNTDPAANERIGNFYLAEKMPEFNEEFAGQYNWVNVPRDYNLALDLVAAVQNNGE